MDTLEEIEKWLVEPSLFRDPQDTGCGSKICTLALVACVIRMAESTAQFSKERPLSRRESYCA
jgi:hypothetical protein